MMTQPTCRRWRSLFVLASCLLLPAILAGCGKNTTRADAAVRSADTAVAAEPPSGPKDPEGDIKIKDPGPGGPTGW